MYRGEQFFNELQIILPCENMTDQKPGPQSNPEN